jgi:riboflavin kinase / FMN adenylyltransferase
MMHPTTHSAGVYALGNFDGVHRGHQAVLRIAKEKAQELSTFAAAMTFEPHPRRLFNPDLPPFRLTPSCVKHRMLTDYGMQQIAVVPFTPEFAQHSAEDFAHKILRDQHNVAHIVTGADFAFGKSRGGNAARLAEWLQPYGISVTAVPPVLDDKQERYSATRARNFLQQGDARAAAHILGRPWTIAGNVMHGDGRGHQISFPTANIGLGEYLRPRLGVYAVLAHFDGDGTRYTGVANIGTRPTVGGTEERLEFHLLDFNQKIYDQMWWVEFIEFIRPEQKFPSLDALKAQIAIDCVAARKALLQPLRF